MADKLIIRKRVPVVTRHKALVAYLLDRDIIKEGEYSLIEHADYQEVQGQDVIGVLPLQLASYAKSITEVPLNLTPEMRGKELTFDEVSKIAEKPVKYIVREVDSTDGVDYYYTILEGYNDKEYELAYKYYRHTEIDKQYFKDFDEIAKARTVYGDIINALFGIFDIYTIENRGWREFEFMRLPRLRYRCSLVYDDETTSPVSIEMEEFTRDKVLKFIDKLIEMCL